MVVFQSKFMGYAIWLDKKKLKFRRGLFQTSDEKEIEALSKDKNVVRLQPKAADPVKPVLPPVEEPVVKKAK